MIELIQMYPSEKLKEIISNPYELIQYIQYCNFTENFDHIYKYIDGNQWAIHKSGLEALKFNKGSCSSMVGIFYYLLQDKFESIGNLCIISNSGGGHAVNYIEFENNLYFIDLYVQMNSYSSYIPIETGEKQDFVRTKYITGGCLKTDSLQSYIRYFEKYNVKKNKEFLYYTYYSDTCPPVSIQKINDKLIVLLPKDNEINIVNNNYFKKINYKFVNYY